MKNDSRILWFTILLFYYLTLIGVIIDTILYCKGTESISDKIEKKIWES